MTNKEKYKEVFGIEMNDKYMSVCSCIEGYPECRKTCGGNNYSLTRMTCRQFWNDEYKEIQNE